MNQKRKSKILFYLLTETALYRSDQMLKQIDEWIHALQTGELIETDTDDSEALDEFEAHLKQTYLKTRDLLKRH